MRRMLTGPMQFTPYRPWSEERKAARRDKLGSPWVGKRAWLVEQMWNDECTFQMIGGAIGETRSAVAGYIRRRGLHRKDTQSATGLNAPHNPGERLPSGDAAVPVADTLERRLPTPEQLERIGHRQDIIRGLTRAIEQSSEPEFIKRANWTIEQKKFEIEGILFQDASVFR